MYADGFVIHKSCRYNTKPDFDARYWFLVVFTKTPVFGIFNRVGKLYTEIVPDCLTLIFRSAPILHSLIGSDHAKLGLNG